jgi:hypothetical protein
MLWVRLRRVFRLPRYSAVGRCRILVEILGGEEKLEQQIETQPSLLEMWKEWNKSIMQERRARAEAVKSIDLRRTCWPPGRSWGNLPSSSLHQPVEPFARCFNNSHSTRRDASSTFESLRLESETDVGAGAYSACPRTRTQRTSAGFQERFNGAFTRNSTWYPQVHLQTLTRWSRMWHMAFW